MADHFHQARPGEDRCFVCRMRMDDAYRLDSGLRPLPRPHEPVIHAYGDGQLVEECVRCVVEWPCPAIKAITRNAAKARRKRKETG